MNNCNGYSMFDGSDSLIVVLPFNTILTGRLMHVYNCFMLLQKKHYFCEIITLTIDGFSRMIEDSLTPYHKISLCPHLYVTAGHCARHRQFSIAKSVESFSLIGWRD